MPKIWKSEGDLVADLRSDWGTRALDAISIKADWETTINIAIRGNTFRAFRRLPNKPSQVFRDWASGALVTRGYFEQLKGVRSQSDYDKWLLKLVNDLRRHWKRRMAVNLPFGPSYKLPNLLMKCVCQEMLLSRRKQVRMFLHVALDRYTLAGIRSFIMLPGGRTISSTASMGFIKTEQDYVAIQEGIRKVAKRAGVPPIAYDYLAWDSGH
jgi:hypothetical protein